MDVSHIIFILFAAQKDLCEQLTFKNANNTCRCNAEQQATKSCIEHM